MRVWLILIGTDCGHDAPPRLFPCSVELLNALHTGNDPTGERGRRLGDRFFLFENPPIEGELDRRWVRGGLGA